MAEQRPDPIIVFGAPRSGTTYLQELLNMHPDVFVSHETRIFAWLHDAVSVLTHEDRCLVTYREQFIDHLRSALPQVIRDFYRSLAADAIYWGDKNPHYADWNNDGCLELIADLFPNARFIDLIRDGRHVVSSLLDADRRRHTLGGFRLGPPHLDAARRSWAPVRRYAPELALSSDPLREARHGRRRRRA